MIFAVAGYLGAIGLAWGHVAAHGFPWTLFLWLCPVLWGIGLGTGAPAALRIGLYAAVGLAVWAVLMRAVLPGIGAAVLALWAWDAASLAVCLARAGKVTNPRRVWAEFVGKSWTVGAVGGAVALGFSWVQIAIPFPGLVGLLAGALTALAVFRRAATGGPRPSEDRQAGSGPRDRYHP